MFIGAFLLGHRVVKTLSGGIVPAKYININVALIIIFSTTSSLFIANILKIPQSTSWVTVFSLVAAGLYFGNINTKKITTMIIAWITLPTLSYMLSVFLYKFIYPPRQNNLRLYEKIFANDKNLRLTTILMSCYVAFAIGSNNVANVVGPLRASGVFDNTFIGMVIMAPLFGLGALFLGKGNLSSFGCDIVPLGIVSASIASFVTATLLIFASALGIPMSLVQLNFAAIFAVSHLKNGFSQTRNNPTTKKHFMYGL